MYLDFRLVFLNVTQDYYHSYGRIGSEPCVHVVLSMMNLQVAWLRLNQYQCDATVINPIERESQALKLKLSKIVLCQFNIRFLSSQNKENTTQAIIIK